MTFSQVRSYVKELIKSLGLTPVEGLSSSDIQDLKDAFDASNSSVINPLSPGFTPIGTIISVMGNTAPPNYLICNGQTVNISDYPELANYFEQQFGTKNNFGGDGETTFAVPDLRGEFLRGTGKNGASVGTHQDSGLPNITADPFWCDWYVQTGFNTLSVNGAFVKGPNTPGRITGEANASNAASFGFDASKSNPIYGASDDVQPPNTSVLYCIAVRNIYIEQIKSENIYSLDEKIVGQWIDGKPLYQKTFQFDNMTINGTQQNFGSLSGLNIGNYAEIVHSALNEDNYWTNPGILCVWIRVPQDNFGVKMVDGVSRHGSLYFTLQYTKTTD